MDRMRPSDRAQAIFARISEGHKNAVKRPWDSKTDRSLRKMIEEANNNGDCIIARQNGDGYYRPLPSDPIDRIEFRAYMKQNHEKAKSIQLKEMCMLTAYKARAEK